MRVHPVGARPAVRLTLLTGGVVVLVAVATGTAAWCWTQAACLISLRAPVALPVADAAAATWRLVLHDGWANPAAALPRPSERLAAPGRYPYLAVGVLSLGALARAFMAARRLSWVWGAGSPLDSRSPVRRRAVDGGWVRRRTWADPRDLRRLWVPGPVSGRPYLGVTAGGRRRMLAAEREVQPMVVAPPRAGKSTGFVVPWLLDHDGPALVLSTKRDIHDATVAHRRTLGEVWVYDPFGDPGSAVFTPLVPAGTWSGAIRAGEALASAAHPDQANAANEFWDKEAAGMLAPLLHAASLAGRTMGDVVRWLDARHFVDAVAALKRAGADAAADQLEGVGRRDERNRETTVMSALNLLRAYRHPQLHRRHSRVLTPRGFLDGDANTVYVVAAGHDQEMLRPVILALLAATYEAAVEKARASGPLEPRLFMLMDEAANIAPVRNLASWLSQCGDHGIVIATIWQSIAQIDQRYGRAARDAICAASTAQIFIPPLADPTTTGYLTGVLGEEPVANGSGGGPRQTLTVAHRKAAPAPWLRQIGRGRAILLYRDLPPAVVDAPGWFEDPRFTRRPAVRSSGRRARPADRNTR